MAVRRAIVAGQFYPEDKEELLDSIRKSFTSKFGPGALPGKRGRGRVYGAVAPHAGYFFSGAGAAWVYKEIAETEFPDTYVILGVNHSGPDTCSSTDDWETPLGVVKCDTELVRLMYKKGLPLNSKAHTFEHSIEVQLPFLQFASTDRTEKLRIAPVMIADEEFERWGRIIKEAAKELGRKIVIICSSDFTHYGEGYGYTPFSDDVPARLKKLDEDAIFFITKPNPASFFDYTEKTGATICGRYGICALLWLMKYLGEEKKGTLLKYYTSGDVVADYSNAVGYAAIVFR
ncbi:AmmeMemoRadiSam system protein B [Candidatus Woesearchaeota archaeon]|nr:AmmeMemoRadiSam system protein B [Candidatus Woesearchaeota archaeon]